MRPNGEEMKRRTEVRTKPMASDITMRGLGRNGKEGECNAFDRIWM